MNAFKLILCILCSFVLASAINVYPLSFELARYRPMLLLLVLIFWAIYQPRWVGVGIAFVVGLISDLLLDTHLGYQALCAVASIFVVRALTRYTKRLDLTSAWILVLVALTTYRVLLWVLQSFGALGFVWVGFRGYVVSILLFPIIWQVLMIAQNKFDKHQD